MNQIKSVKIHTKENEQMIIADVCVRRQKDEGEACQKRFILSLSVYNGGARIGQKVDTELLMGPEESIETRILFPLMEEPLLWDEFEQNLYTARLTLISEDRNEQIVSDTTFGFCEIRTVGTRFTVNGTPVFIRALTCSNWQQDLTVDEWQTLFKKAKARGLNTWCFEGGCPKEEAFTAADLVGLYIQVELPEKEKQPTAILQKTSCHKEEQEETVSQREDELKDLLTEYGNHPSFVMLYGYDQICRNLDEEQMYTGHWREYAIRDRQDYSDAPDTRSKNLEYIVKGQSPTLLTRLGECRYETREPLAPGMEYLSAICCREEIEGALRTPGFGGIKLHEKAAVLNLPERRMKEFCCEMVPLLLMKKYVWTTDETFRASLTIANYTKHILVDRITVSAVDESGTRVIKTSGKVRITNGNVVQAGEVEIPLDQFAPGQRIELQISVDNTNYRNHYSIWLFSDEISVTIPEHVHISRTLDERTRRLIFAGKKIILIPWLNMLPKAKDCWFSPLLSENTLDRSLISTGLRLNPLHPALRGFPTENEADYQWWNLVQTTCTLPAEGFTPIVSLPPVPGEKEEHLMIGEVKIGEAKVLVVLSDLVQQLDRPEARQLYNSLLRYAASPSFAPEKTMSLQEFEAWLGKNEA